MQYVEIELDPQEVVVAEPGGFMMMDNGIQMQTIFGDGSNQQSGFMGKLLSAGKRMLTGESLFMTAYQNQNAGKAKVSFASPYPGKIIALDLQQHNGKFICQKDAFLCAAKGVSVGIEFSTTFSPPQTVSSNSSLETVSPARRHSSCSSSSGFASIATARPSTVSDQLASSRTTVPKVQRRRRRRCPETVAEAVSPPDAMAFPPPSELLDTSIKTLISQPFIPASRPARRRC